MHTTPPGGRQSARFDFPVRFGDEEPLMFVKVNARREYLDVLLGFEEAVLAVGRHSAQVFSWLVRYGTAPVHFIEACA